VLAAALALVLKRAPLLRVIAAVAAALCLVGIFLTLSRGGLVALLFALGAAILAGGRWRISALVLAVVIALSGFFYFGYFAPQGAASRITKVQGGTGRTDIWEVGWRMVQAHPVRGVGAGQFQTSSIHYLLEPGSIERDEFIVDTPKVAHNTYLQVLAELGIVGAALFLAILGFSLLCILRAARIFERLGDGPLELLSRALLVALIGVLAADFFISQQFSKQLWLLIGLGPAFLGIAHSARRAHLPEPQ
jgi:O-antigen ligase